MPPSTTGERRAPGERVAHQLELIRARDDGLKAIVRTLGESALRDAEALERSAGGGVASGWTVAVKDNVDVAGVVATDGRAEPWRPAPALDSVAVARVRRAGGIVLAKTNLAELGLGATTQNRRWGACANPHDLARIPGGSSGGSAVAVAAGLCDVAIGTDTGGSVRNPAAFCGVLGLRPTAGRIPLSGVTPLSPSFDVVGPLAPDAAALATLLAALEGKPAVAAASDRVMPGRALAGARIGVPERFFHDDLDGDVACAIERAQVTLQAGGAQLRPLELPGAGAAREALALLIDAHGAALHADELRDRPERFDPEVRARLLAGGTATASTLATAERVRARWSAAVASALDGLDAIAVPTVPFPAPRRDAGGMVEMTTQINRLTAPWSLAGVPALSIPCPRPRGALPVGLQLIAAPHGDWRLVAMAAAFERAAASAFA